jgi:hypothetical protein
MSRIDTMTCAHTHTAGCSGVEHRSHQVEHRSHQVEHRSHQVGHRSHQVEHRSQARRARGIMDAYLQPAAD